MLFLRASAFSASSAFDVDSGTTNRRGVCSGAACAQTALMKYGRPASLLPAAGTARKVTLPEAMRVPSTASTAVAIATASDHRFTRSSFEKKLMACVTLLLPVVGS